MNLGRWLVVLGSVILMATAVLHTIAYKGISEAIGKGGLSATLSGGLRGFCLLFGLQLAFLTVLFVMMAWMPRGKGILIFAALIPVSETILLVHFVGWFPGTEMLAAGAVGVFAGAILLPAN
ncbi:MAG TPA: hypothetical protein VGT03_07190 [Candidatus Acidoferrales bacterium]|nr:hypothetical protein [Candidatus Acidoferrales bacterium]